MVIDRLFDRHSYLRDCKQSTSFSLASSLTRLSYCHLLISSSSCLIISSVISTHDKWTNTTSPGGHETVNNILFLVHSLFMYPTKSLVDVQSKKLYRKTQTSGADITFPTYMYDTELKNTANYSQISSNSYTTTHNKSLAAPCNACHTHSPWPHVTADLVLTLSWRHLIIINRHCRRQAFNILVITTHLNHSYEFLTLDGIFANFGISYRCIETVLTLHVLLALLFAISWYTHTLTRELLLTASVFGSSSKMLL